MILIITVLLWTVRFDSVRFGQNWFVISARIKMIQRRGAAATSNFSCPLTSISASASPRFLAFLSHTKPLFIPQNMVHCSCLRPEHSTNYSFQSYGGHGGYGGGYGGGGYGGGGGGGGGGGWGDDRMSNLGGGLKAVDWSSHKLEVFEKNFYVEDKRVSARSDREIEEFRRTKEMKVSHSWEKICGCTNNFEKSGPRSRRSSPGHFLRRNRFP